MQENKPEQTPVFGIAIFIFFIIFIIILNHLPFPSDYGFGELTGICVGSCLIVAIVFGITTELVEAIFKIFVEVMAALLLLVDAIYVATCWSMLEDAKQYFGVDTLPTVLILLFILLLANLLAIVVLYPLSRIAGTTLNQ